MSPKTYCLDLSYYADCRGQEYQLTVLNSRKSCEKEEQNDRNKNLMQSSFLLGFSLSGDINLC